MADTVRCQTAADSRRHGHIRHRPRAGHWVTFATVRLADARRYALSLPETTEEPHFELGSFRVRGKIFATIPGGGEQLRIFVGIDEVQALIAENPTAFEQIVWGKRVVPNGVCVNLAAADASVVRELLEEAWRLRAPKRVVAAFDAGM